MFINKYSEAFLANLPARANVIKTLFKSVAGLALGIGLSFLLNITLLSSSLSTVYESKIFTIGTVTQNILLLLFFVLLFYSKSYKNIKGQLFQKYSNKSYIVTISVILLLFIITTAVFILSNNGLKLDENQLAEVAKYYDQPITITYLFSSFFGLFFYLITAFFEEFIFRFTIYRFLRRSGLVLALAISSLLFALVHGGTSVPFSFIFGIFAALHYEQTNSFTRTVVIHALHNYLNIYYASYLAYILLK